MQTYIENAQLIEMMKGAHQNLALNKSYVDSLNVFPVPDGDTGTNMGLTMASVVKELSAGPAEIKDTAVAFAKGALKGARGNSGVILSQILKGMSEIFIEAKSINTKTFAKALISGAEKAYSAVTVPKEGTMLTVIRVIGEYAVKIAGRTQDFVEFFKKIIKKGEETLADTPKLLAVLAKAGVVDSGGQGLIYILIGMYNVLAGIEMEPVATTVAAPTMPEEKLIAFENDVHDLENIRFAYCTEFFIINLKKQITTADIDKLRDKLQKIGDCVLVVGDLDTVKVHVHTNSPDKALGYALQLGELNLPKIENMREQNKKLVSEKPKERKHNGLLAISSGSGFREIFGELGADDVLEGGQTMNPSVNDIVEKVNKIYADNVFVLPNNKNIILACEQAKDLVDCNLVVIATVNVPNGISAAMSYDPEGDPEEVAEAMSDACSGVSCIQVTHAVRDTEMDGFNLHNGDIIALEKGIIAQGHEIDRVVLTALDTKDKDSVCLITLYYGEDVAEKDAESLRAKVAEVFTACDVMAVRGGQAHYCYLISVE